MLRPYTVDATSSQLGSGDKVKKRRKAVHRNMSKKPAKSRCFWRSGGHESGHSGTAS